MHDGESVEVATSLNNLAELLHAKGDYAAARPFYERALQIREATRGSQHPDTALSLHNLAAMMQTQGDYLAAQPLYERALEIHEVTRGPQHPDTATSLHNLALLLYAQGDYATACPLYERALTIREAALGHQHPDTRNTRTWLGLLLLEYDAPARACDLLAKNAQAPDDSLAHYWHGLALLIAGDRNAAIAALNRSLALASDDHIRRSYDAIWQAVIARQRDPAASFAAATETIAALPAINQPRAQALVATLDDNVAAAQQHHQTYLDQVQDSRSRSNQRLYLAIARRVLPGPARDEMHAWFCAQLALPPKEA